MEVCVEVEGPAGDALAALLKAIQVQLLDERQEPVRLEERGEDIA
jgi:hypothetical protein